MRRASAAEPAPVPLGTIHPATAVAPACPPATSNVALNLYLLFIASWFLHVPARLPVLAIFRVDLLLLCVISALIATGGSANGTSFSTRTNRLIVMLVGYAIVTLPFVEWPGSVVKNGLPDYAKALVFYYFTVRLVTTEGRLARLLFVFVICQTFRVLEPLYLHLTQGYWGSAASMSDYSWLPRLSGAPSDVINPNGLAFIIVTLVPFFHYLWTMSRLRTLVYLTVLPAFLYALSLTGSRSGMVALAITFLTIWYRSRRKVVTAVVAIAVLVVAVPFLSDDLKDRYLSIVDSNTKNAQTAHERVDGMYADFEVAMRRPLFGYGLGTSQEANVHFSGRNLPSHNLITQVLQELGTIGLVLFLLLIGTIFGTVRRSLRHFGQSVGSSPLLLRLSRTVEVWLVMNILFSLFSYGLASYEWYFIAGLAEATRMISTSEAVDDPIPPPVVRGVRLRHAAMVLPRAVDRMPAVR